MQIDRNVSRTMGQSGSVWCVYVCAVCVLRVVCLCLYSASLSVLVSASVSASLSFSDSLSTCPMFEPTADLSKDRNPKAERVRHR